MDPELDQDTAVAEWTKDARKWHIEQVHRVKETQTAEVIDGTICDLFSTSVILTVFEALSAENQEKAQRLPFATFAQFAWKHVKGGSL